MAGIDTHIPGKPAQVRSAADFLGKTLRSAVADAGEGSNRARSKARDGWEGQSGEAYAGLSRELVKAADHQEGHLKEAGQKFDAYAYKLEAIQNRMADRRTRATGGGLILAGEVITEPAPAQSPGDLPAGSTPEESAAWDQKNAKFEAQNKRIELYNEIAKEVEEDNKDLQDWVDSNLKKFWSTVDGPSPLDVVIAAIKKLPPAMTGMYFDTNERRLTKYANHTRAEAARLRREADEAVRNRRSGHPGRRAAGDATDVRGNRAAARGLDALGEGAERFARRLPVIGTVASIGFAAGEIANGESPSKVVVGEAAGVAGGALGAAAVVGGAALIGVGAPVIAVAAGAAAVGVVVGLGAEYAYENWVSDETREKIDDGLEAVGDAITFWD
ncbi:hypothetical protein ACFVJS_21365 [Nocardioides sp. NPDC057772]|uniref:hypothetical protein n=1 Tax=Nocardioides sp. NPDC057772 TaxID=3346245 RepID=UPI00366CB92E